MTTQLVEHREFRNKEGILIRYPIPICHGKIWRYHGTMARYATCSSCRRNVNIQQNRAEEYNISNLAEDSTLSQIAGLKTTVEADP